MLDEMTVVMVGPFAFRPKGTVRARAFLIARALVNLGHRVTILMPPYDNLSDSGRVWEQDGVRLENARLRRNDRWHQLAVPLWLARRAAQLAPNVVHVFKPIGYSGMAGWYLRRFSRVALVLDTDDWEGRGGWSDINPYPPLWRCLFTWQERWLALHAHAVTVASRTLEAQVWGFGVPPEHVHYLPNGPDESLRDTPRDIEQRVNAVRQRLGVGDAPMALYLGLIPHGTDLGCALEAFARVRRELPEARLVIAGVGDALSDLRCQAEQLRLGGTVLFPGWVDPAEAGSIMAAADLLVNPYQDTLINRAKCPAKIVTAMAAGRAVVTSDVGESRTYVEHGRTGLLTAPGDVADLSRAMQALLSDRRLAKELGERARQRVWERFGWDVRAGEVELIYKQARHLAGLRQP